MQGQCYHQRQKDDMFTTFGQCMAFSKEQIPHSLKRYKSNCHVIICNNSSEKTKCLIQAKTTHKRQLRLDSFVTFWK